MSQPVHRGFALIAALVSFVATLGIGVVTIAAVLRFAYGWRHPHDASTSDSAGWALIIGAPIFLPLAVFAAAAMAVWIYRKLRRA